jgi:hypothetical protein
MEPRLHNTQEISQRHQLHNALGDIDVKRVASNNSEYCNPDHFDIWSSFGSLSEFIHTKNKYAKGNL